MSKATLSKAARLLGQAGGRARSRAKTAAARMNGERGGLSRSPAKVAAARKNGRKGGRPKGSDRQIRRGR